MKPLTTNQEILLFKDTSFSNREFSNTGKYNNRPEANSPAEELEKACWAGMLFDILPELNMDPLASYKMLIWNIYSAEHFLLIHQGTDPYPDEASFSIDPQLIASGTNFS